MDNLTAHMAFDWYQCTIRNKVDNILECLGQIGEDIEFVQGQGIRQYERALHVQRGAETLAVLSYGGNNGSDPNLRSTGLSAALVAPLIKTDFPQHRVTRVDVAIDFSGERIFNEIHSAMDALHLEHGIYRRDFGFASPENGRTYYLGSPKSPAQCRLYEKGKKEIREGNFNADPFWVRLEMQYRPRQREKAKFAQFQPFEIWGCTKWSRNLLSSVIGMRPTPIRQEKPVDTSAEEKVRYAFQQYRRHLEAIGEEEAHKILGELIFDKWRAKTSTADVERCTIH